jgi:hypothetical protein
MELIRLTATNWPDGKVLMDVLVYPMGEILDLNSRYSGVTGDDILQAQPWSLGNHMENPEEVGRQVPVTSGETKEHRPIKHQMKIVSSPVVARDILFTFIAPHTPLIGHALENDLNAVRVVHPTIVDTALLFPHKRGMPIRHGLRALMEVHLNKAIQVVGGDGALGHDSAEDARAAGELVRLKVEEKWKGMKGKGWVVAGTTFTSPKPTASKRAVSATGALTEKFLEDDGAVSSRGGARPYDPSASPVVMGQGSWQAGEEEEEEEQQG